jgi:endonuclease YncB( thermonuclease family)
MIHFDLTQLPPQSTAHAARCFDGDTLRITGEHFAGIMRIWGIDAPERGQPWFTESLESLKSLTKNVQLTIIPVTWDRYNRLVAKLLGHRYEDIGLRMIQQGDAWWENLHAPDATDNAAAHVAARNAKLGLWSLPSPHVPPWIFRRKFHHS